MAGKKASKAKPKSKMKPMSLDDIQLTQDIKRANQRLRELEKQRLQNSPAYHAVERLALKGDPAIKTGTHTENKGKPNETKTSVLKFNTNVRSLTQQQREHLRQEVHRFLGAKTSTKSGIKEVQKTMLANYKSKHGNLLGDVDDAELAEFLTIWDTSIAKQFKALYGSDFTNQVIDVLYADQVDKDDAEQFLTDHFGEYAADIQDTMEHEFMEAGDGTPWDWNDIFNSD